MSTTIAPPPNATPPELFPPPPSIEPSKPKRSKGKIAAMFAGGIVLLVVGAALGSDQGTDAPQTGADAPQTGVVTECIDQDAAVEHSEAASTYLESAGSAAEALDVAGSGSFLRLAADEVEAAAFAADADPSISEPLLAAAAAYRLAASQVEAFEIDAATRSLSQGVAQVNASTQAVNDTSVPVC